MSVKANTVLNYPMQANGAEMLRLACCYATEAGVSVCGPVHDALLIEAKLEDLEEAIAITQQAMSDASSVVLAGFRLRTEVNRILCPERYQDPRGKKVWDMVQGILSDMESGTHGKATSMSTNGQNVSTNNPEDCLSICLSN